MKSLVHFILSYCLFFQVSFAQQVGQGHPEAIKHNTKKAFVDNFSEVVSKVFKRGINEYNDNIKNPEYFAKKLKKKFDKGSYLKLLKKGKVTSLPKIAFNKKRSLYEVEFGKDIIAFDIVAAYKGTILYNGHKVNMPMEKSFKNQFQFFENIVKKYSKNFNKKPVTSTSEKILDFFFPRAEAFIFTTAGIAVVGGALLLGTLGWMAYGAIQDAFGEGSGYEALKALRDSIKEKANQCSSDMKEVKDYNKRSHSYNDVSPGNFKTFGLLRSFIEEDANLDKEKIKEHFYTVVNKNEDLEDIKDCEKLAEKLIENSTLGEKRTNKMEMASGGGIKYEVCAEQEKLVTCLENFDAVHYNHSGRKNLLNRAYDSDRGVYDGQETYEETHDQ